MFSFPKTGYRNKAEEPKQFYYLLKAGDEQGH